MIKKNNEGYLELYGNDFVEKLLISKFDLESQKAEINLLLNSNHDYIQFVVDALAAKISIIDAITNCLMSSINSAQNTIFEVYEFEDPEIQSVIRYHFDEDHILENKNDKLIALSLKVNVRKEYNDEDEVLMLGIKFTYEISLMDKENFDSNQNEEIKLSTKSRYKPNFSLQPKLIRLTYAEALSLAKYIC